MRFPKEKSEMVGRIISVLTDSEKEYFLNVVNVCQDYIEDISSQIPQPDEPEYIEEITSEPIPDSDLQEVIFEKTLELVFGLDVWNFLNNPIQYDNDDKE